MIFKKTKRLELKTNEYLDRISESGLVFMEGLQAYLSGNEEASARHLEHIRCLEQEADTLRKDIEIQLYSETLIPESRGDVLALLETSDDVIDRAANTLTEFSIEMPDIPEKFHTGYIELGQAAAKAMEVMVLAMRTFLTDPLGVREHLHKVAHYEHEADLIAEKLKREVFRDNELRKSEKIHLRYFALHVDMIADYAEDVADRLSIYTIKRSI